MALREDIYHSVLIVSLSEQFGEVVKKSLAPSHPASIDFMKSAAAARRCILERYYNLIVINGPLPDESGENLAIDAAEKSNASILLAAPREIYGEVQDHVTDYGILVLPKPTSRRLVEISVRYLTAIQNKMHELERETIKAEEKLEEMRIVNKAKFLLVEKRHMTEDQAHRFLGKEAMNHGISRKRAAQIIIDDLE